MMQTNNRRRIDEAEQAEAFLRDVGEIYLADCVQRIIKGYIQAIGAAKHSLREANELRAQLRDAGK